MTRVLVTGGAGFIGHHFVNHFLVDTDWEIVVLDKLNYASCGWDRIRDINVFNPKRVSLLSADFVNPINQGLAKEIGDVDYIFHLGAETHVLNSIINPEPFVMSNVAGTMRVLDFARSLSNLKKFFLFSTDEYYGHAPDGIAYKEWDRPNPTNPYSASKAGGEMLGIAYANTYGLPVIITNCMNVFGERQHPEKFIPKTIKHILSGEKVPVHYDPNTNKIGSRSWIHARNVSAAIMFLIEHGKVNDKYNIIGEKELDNLQIAQFIAKVLGKELNYELIDPNIERPGHDFRYALDGAKMRELGWELPISFEKSLEKTIRWGLEKLEWFDINTYTRKNNSLQVSVNSLK